MIILMRALIYGVTMLLFNFSYLVATAIFIGRLPSLVPANLLNLQAVPTG